MLGGSEASLHTRRELEFLVDLSLARLELQVRLAKRHFHPLAFGNVDQGSFDDPRCRLFIVKDGRVLQDPHGAFITPAKTAPEIGTRPRSSECPVRLTKPCDSLTIIGTGITLM
jgi:hypothetical protein